MAFRTSGGYTGYQTPNRNRLSRAAGGGGTSGGRYTDEGPFGLGTLSFGQPISVAQQPAARPAAPAQSPSGAAGSQVQGQQFRPPPQEAPLAPSYSYDPMTDPALQAVYAYTGRADEDARGQALKDKTLLATRYGDPEFARAAGLGENEVQAARDNPFSLLAKAAADFKLGTTDLEEQLNKRNLFYSGYRANQLGQNETNYQRYLADASSGVQGQFGGIEQALAQALGQNAYQRLQALLGVKPPQGPFATTPPPSEPTGGEPTPGALIDPSNTTSVPTYLSERLTGASPTKVTDFLSAMLAGAAGASPLNRTPVPGIERRGRLY